MAGYNRVVMVGNLTRDPDYRQLASGQAVCRLGLASNRQFKNRQTGDMIQEVCFVDIDVWGAQAESCSNYLAKGRQVLVEGRLKFDTWQDANGQNRSKHSIVADRVVFLASPANEEAQKGNQASSGTTSAKTTGSTQATSSKAGSAASELDPAVEKELADQIERVKKQSNTSEHTQTDAPSQQEQGSANNEHGENATFKDEPPFQDDLPF